MPSRETLVKLAKLSGRTVLGGVSLALTGAEAMNGIATDFLGASNSLANEFSGSSTSNIGPKIYDKTSKLAFAKAMAATKWADKKLK